MSGDRSGPGRRLPGSAAWTILTPDETELPNIDASESPARILITDDRPETLDLIDSSLGVLYDCEFAGSVQEAREKLVGGDYQLALCDVNAAGEAGLSLATLIVSEFPDTAVVLLTDEDDPKVAEKAFDLGVYGYLVEPLQPGQLLITTMNALRSRELETASRAHSRNLEARVQEILDVAPIAIYAKDLSGRFVIANRMADAQAGLEPGQLLGSTDDRFLTPEVSDASPDIDRRVIEERAPHERVDSVDIRGESRRFKTIRFPLFDEQSRVTAVGGVSVDMTAELEANRLRDELALSQQKSIEDLELSRRETIAGLAMAIDLHDTATGIHTERMAAIAAYLGAKMGLDPECVQLLRAAAPMHDAGKIGTSAEILRKKGPLSDEERSEMQRHTIIGHRIFSKFESDLSRLAASVALSHHERYDGQGYPKGLRGEEIPLEGRITAVADVFDALLSDRSYRKAMSVPEAVDIIAEGRGTHFDPEIADALLENLPECLALRASIE